ncbi:hypothetical protein ACRALDRAFT_1066462 [Sodiomyces alcalophilus JCM 7366]|uniref:uncharacterized protein n=1 Tax=Sodiomyces alcalophilus JCM 7366 TaxID=591952 RepID=UPI0039B4D414
MKLLELLIRVKHKEDTNYIPLPLSLGLTGTTWANNVTPDLSMYHTQFTRQGVGIRSRKYRPNSLSDFEIYVEAGQITRYTPKHLRQKRISIRDYIEAIIVFRGLISFPISPYIRLFTSRLIAVPRFYSERQHLYMLSPPRGL